MERYERAGPRTPWFWEISVEGAVVRVRHGPVGADAVTRARALGSATNALEEGRRLVAQKVREGYARVGGDGLVAREGAAQGAAVGPGERPARLDELEAHVAARLGAGAGGDGALAALAVYADALMEAGDPLGEYLALRARGGSDRERAAAVAARVYGALPRPDERSGVARAKSFVLVFEHGLVREAVVKAAPGPAATEILTALAAAPVARFVRVLRISRADATTLALARPLRWLAELYVQKGARLDGAPLAGAGLRTLMLPAIGADDLDWLASLDELTELYAHAWDLADPGGALPRLEALHLGEPSRGKLPAGALARVATLRRLRRLSLWGLDATSLAPLAGLTELREVAVARAPKLVDVAALASWPALRRLALSDTGVSSLEPLRATHALEEVALSGAALTDVSPLWGHARIRSLDLRGSGVRSLEGLAALTRLESLWIAGTPAARSAAHAGLPASVYTDVR